MSSFSRPRPIARGGTAGTRPPFSPPPTTPPSDHPPLQPPPSTSFWGAKISDPFSRGDESSITLLNLLLSGTMIRHSKSQHFVDQPDRSLLDLPSPTRFLHGVDLTEQERTVNYFLECTAKQALDGDADWAAEDEDEERKTKKGPAVMALELLRQCAQTPHLITGGVW